MNYFDKVKKNGIMIIDFYGKDELKNNGFTFEFYGTWSCGKSYKENKEIQNPNNYGGLFCYWNGDEKYQAGFRFGFNKNRIIVECWWLE